MSFSLLTYNVLFNSAYLKVGPLLKEYAPDIICLQEVDTNEDNLKTFKKFGYNLADYSNSFIKMGKIYGSATFYNPNTIEYMSSKIINLPRGFYEVITLILKLLRGKNQSRTILKTVFTIKGSPKKIAIYNSHLTVHSTNSLRMKQIKETLNDIELKNNDPIIVAGDFNYFPYGRKRLENLMRQHRLIEATKNIGYTIKYSLTPQLKKVTKLNILESFFFKFIGRLILKKLKIDYIFYKNLSLLNTKRIDVVFSDHYPIISTFEV